MGETRGRGRLSARFVETVTRAGRHPDGLGLYLHVRPSGSKSWVVRVQSGGRRRDIGLGGYPKVGLATARELTLAIHDRIARGIDPVAERRRARGIPTFAEAARRRFAELAPTFRNAKHRAQWIATLAAHAFPHVGDLPVDAVTEADVRRLLAPIWTATPETARRVRQRVADVLAWARAEGWRPDVPDLSPRTLKLPAQPKAVRHHAAMPFDAVPAFMARLAARDGVAALALRFLVLTAARSGEVRGMTWDEVDEAARLWTVPAARMKAGRAHVVPLAGAALLVLADARRLAKAGSALVFPSPGRGVPLSDMALTKLLRDMGETVTAHGFRSSFRDLVAERTAFPPEVAEMALAHAIPDRVEAAYRRGQLLEKRRELMAAWAAFACGGGPA
ncbi:MAG: tyrosine-type recombinase/integrase [Thermaurantiacus tibetensis]